METSSKLAAAAEALVKAAVSETEATSMSCAKYTVTALESLTKQSKDLNATTQKLHSSAEKSEKSLQQLETTIAQLVGAVNGLVSEQKKASKDRCIEFAIETVMKDTTRYCFRYYYNVKKNDYYSQIQKDEDKISTLLLNILFCFRKDCGYYIPRAILGQPTREVTDEEYEAFKNKVVDLLHELLGAKPVVSTTNGRDCLYHA